MIYEYECNFGHRFDYICSHTSKPMFVSCYCGQKAKSIIVSAPFVTAIFGNGKSLGEHIASDNRDFKTYRDMENYCKRNNLEPYTLSKAQIKQKQEERKHTSKSSLISSKDKKFKMRVSNDLSNRLEYLKNDKKDRTSEAKDLIKQELG